MEYYLEPESPTILDVLNEDCWRIVLDFIDINDLIQSERVSRQWQNIVLQYLQGVHFNIEYPWYNHEPCQKYRILTMEKDDPKIFNEITRKWGPCIKKADCINKASLQVLAKHCPNLEDITFYGLHDFLLLNGAQHCFKKLKSIHFRGCPQTTDKCISKWLANDTIEELYISSLDHFTGQCLGNLQSSNLRTLSIKECICLKFRNLLSAVDHLKGLKKLELIYVPEEIFDNVTDLVDNLPNLEDLCLRWEEKMVMGNEIAEGISRLGLRRLDLSYNPNVNDEWLEIIARGCRLQELLVEGCMDVSPRGVLAACSAASSTLRALNVCSNFMVQDEHVEELIIACPELRWLDVSYCSRLTPEVVGRAGAAARTRGRGLRLRVERTPLVHCDADKVFHPWLTLDFSE